MPPRHHSTAKAKKRSRVSSEDEDEDEAADYSDADSLTPPPPESSPPPALSTRPKRTSIPTAKAKNVNDDHGMDDSDFEVDDADPSDGEGNSYRPSTSRVASRAGKSKARRRINSDAESSDMEKALEPQKPTLKLKGKGMTTSKDKSTAPKVETTIMARDERKLLPEASTTPGKALDGQKTSEPALKKRKLPNTTMKRPSQGGAGPSSNPPNLARKPATRPPPSTTLFGSGDVDLTGMDTIMSLMQVCM